MRKSYKSVRSMANYGTCTTSLPYPRSRLLQLRLEQPQKDVCLTVTYGVKRWGKSPFQVFPPVPSSSNPTVDNSGTSRQQGVLPPCEWRKDTPPSVPFSGPRATDPLPYFNTVLTPSPLIQSCGSRSDLCLDPEFFFSDLAPQPILTGCFNWFPLFKSFKNLKEKSLTTPQYNKKYWNL